MKHDGIPALRQGEIPCKACGQPGTLSSDERGLRAVTVLHVAQLDGPIAAEHFGGDFEPDWRIERRPDGGFWWCVVEWDGELRVHGTKGEFAAALAEVVRWASPYGPVVSRETRPPGGARTGV